LEWGLFIPGGDFGLRLHETIIGKGVDIYKEVLFQTSGKGKILGESKKLFMLFRFPPLDFKKEPKAKCGQNNQRLFREKKFFDGEGMCPGKLYRQINNGN